MDLIKFIILSEPIVYLIGKNIPKKVYFRMKEQSSMWQIYLSMAWIDFTGLFIGFLIGLFGVGEDFS